MPYTYSIYIPDEPIINNKDNDILQLGLISINQKNITQEDIIDVEFQESIPENDKVDYIVAAASGLVTALLNNYWLGDFSLTEAKNWGNDKTEKFVIFVAKKTTKFKGDDLKEAIRFLEKKFPMNGDSLTAQFGGGLQHHLRDFTHHPTIVGLIFSILSQFTGQGYGTNTDGEFQTIKLLNLDNIGKSFGEKIFFGTVNWIMHLISDMAGSSTGLGEGTGIPGPILALLKEISTLPILKNMKKEYMDKGEISLSQWVSKFFNGTHYYLNDNGVKVRFDLRTELGIAAHVVKSAIPVLANEVIVRSFYFIRRFFNEIKSSQIKSFKELDKLNYDNFLPFNSRNLNKMMIVSSGVFVTVTTGNAAVKSTIKNKGFNNVNFARDFLLNINYVGIGRFTVALYCEGKYFIKDLEKVRKEYLKRQYSMYDAVDFSSLELFSLNDTQTRILHSLKYQKIKWDIENTKTKKYETLKEKWLDEWNTASVQEISINQSNYVIKDRSSLYNLLMDEVKKTGQTRWLYLISLELSLFTPYYTLNIDEPEEYKGLKLESNYIKDVYCKEQTVFSISHCNRIMREYQKSASKIKQQSQKVAIGTSATLLVTAATGGLALAFAPQIAVLIAGSSLASLHGAALTSASLALLGGGSLAAGGLGMAGGTALITGGGAILGVIGATSVSSVLMSSSKVFTLNECAKILTFSREMLLTLNNGKSHIKSIYKLILKRIDNTRMEIDEFKIKSDMNNKENIKYLKNYQTSLKYLERCAKELLELI